MAFASPDSRASFNALASSIVLPSTDPSALTGKAKTNWPDESILNETSINNFYFPSVNFKNLKDFRTRFKKAYSYKIKKNDVLICADTIVYTKNLILGKPGSNKEAIKMLKTISNQRHFVVTGVTLKTLEKEISFYDRSVVYFKKLTNNEIKFYTNNYNPLDKAGGYGIQGFASRYINFSNYYYFYDLWIH